MKERSSWVECKGICVGQILILIGCAVVSGLAEQLKGII